MSTKIKQDSLININAKFGEDDGKITVCDIANKYNFKVHAAYMADINKCYLKVL